MFQILKDQATDIRRRIPILFVDATDGYTPEINVTSPTINISKNGGTFAAGAGTFTQIDATNLPGHYYYQFTTGEIDTLGYISFYAIKSGTTRSYNAVVQVMAYDEFSATNLGLSNLDATVGSRSTLTTAQVNTEVDTALADVGLTTTVTGRIDTTIGSRSTLTAGAVWDEPMAGHTTDDTYGKSVLRAYNNTNAYMKTTGSGAGHIGADVHEMQANVVTAAALDDSAGQDIADQILGRNIAGGSSAGRLVKDSLRFLRNRFTLVGDVLTVYAEDDTTVAWTAVVSTDATAIPITGSNPAGGAA